MKKVVLSGLFGIALLATSCGPSLCDCVALDKEQREAEDKDKFKEDHKSEIEACDKMGKEKRDEIEAIEDKEEKKKATEAFIEELEACEK
tara:strand:+ start:257 stop:526 length:270 start_codon:yes stop_codon:yes gene_type:complete